MPSRWYRAPPPLDIDSATGTIRAARIALGGVAHKPWRVEEAEAALAGKPATEATFSAAADIVLHGARDYGQNDFKLALAHNTIVRALKAATRGTSPAQNEHGEAQ
ncbi:hypothetical protein [Massilia sp. Se16.2.3]|uniref:hypothetical protein n=1 Tax=Massilia sp. Se16.2.3 TaxID=2709303 RepID=UPI0035A6B094